MTVGAPTISLVLPVKETSRAKSRLAVPGNARRRLALALAHHSLDVAVTCLPADQVFVVTADPDVRARALERGAQVVEDAGAGLNPAAERGIAEASARSPEPTVVVMVADLPELTVEALGGFFLMTADDRNEPLHVADRSGLGTTMISLPPAVRIPMVFGVDSAARFLALGCRTARCVPTSLRADLDSLDDLWRLSPERRATLWGNPQAGVRSRSA